STNELGGGGFHFNDNWDMLFSVSEPTVLTSVDVLAETAFSIDVYLRDAAGETLFQAPYALQEGWNTLDIGVEMPNGTDFVIGIEGENEGLFRNNAVPAGAFPVAVADRMSITANTTDSPLDYYYYFYRWVVESPCAPFTSIEEEKRPFGVHPNPSSGMVHLTGVQSGTFVNVTDVQGREVWSGVVGESSKLDLTRLTAGMHFIHLAGERPRRIILTD
ncbi:MAG: T9SS type A sorting domain-containing protein, partial [Flavobacteriales bacterium]